MRKIVNRILLIVDREDLWRAFLHGTIVGIFAGVTIGFLLFV